MPPLGLQGLEEGSIRSVQFNPQLLAVDIYVLALWKREHQTIRLRYIRSGKKRLVHHAGKNLYCGFKIHSSAGGRERLRLDRLAGFAEQTAR